MENLESALATAPKALEALYPLARVLAEDDRRDRALAVLEQASALDESGYVGRVFSAVLHYDYGEWQLAREGIEGIEASNVIAQSLSALLDLETKKSDRLVLHRGALWINETAGRLLAALETRLFAKDATEVNAFHEKLFTGDTDTGSSAATPEREADKADPERFQVDKDWWAALETAFRAGDHTRVTLLYRRKEIPDKWRDIVSRVLNGYSLLALGEAKRALEASLVIAKQNPASAWAHALVGMAMTGLEDRRHAIYAFVRAVQRSDIEMHHVITELAKSLEISIEFLD